jgi:hypothetical protein
MVAKGHNCVQCTLYRGCKYKKEGCPTCCTVDSMLLTHSNAVHSPCILHPLHILTCETTEWTVKS